MPNKSIELEGRDRHKGIHAYLYVQGAPNDDFLLTALKL